MKKWTFIIENEYNGNSRPFAFTITAAALRNISLAVLSILVFSLGLYTVAKIYHLDPNAKYNLSAKKNLINNQISQKNEYVNRLMERMENIIVLEKHMRVLANLDPIPSDVRDLGIGGYRVVDKRINSINGSTREMINNLDSRLYQVENIINFEKRNIDDIKINLSQEHELLKHKPSTMPTRGWVTSKFGNRTHPITGKSEMHRGLDIANDFNTEIYAPADGKVVFSGRLPGYGRVLKIDHGYGYQTIYAHLNRYLVRKGDIVTRHQKIGLMGNSGISTGPHLHYEVRIFNKRIDPMGFIDRDTVIR